MPEQEWNAETVEKLEQQQPEQQPEQKPEAEQQQTEAEQQRPAKPKDTPEVELARMKGALAEERARRRNEMARANELERQIAELRNQQPQKPKEAPDPATDPAGAILHEVGETKEKIEALEKQRQWELQQAQQRQQMEQFVATVRQQADEYAREEPESVEAINWLKAQRVAEYQAAGLSKAEAMRAMLNDELRLSHQALVNGDNPAKLAHEIAKTRGFVSGKQKVQMEEDGKKASLPTAPSSGKSGAIPSLDALLKLKGADFSKATQDWEKVARKFG